MANTPINVHPDVASCLQDILDAVKGEEVRGSIYDAIQLIDTRNVAVVDEVRDTVSQIVDTSILNSNVTSVSPMFTFINNFGQITDYAILYTGGTNGSCNITSSDLHTLINGTRGLYIRIKFEDVDGYVTAIAKAFIDEDDNMHIIATTVLYNGDEHAYVVTMYDIYYAGDEIWGCNYTGEKILTGDGYTPGQGINIESWGDEEEVSVRIRPTNPGLAFDEYGNLYATGGGGGGSYTNGNGIDITNDEISVKLRSTNPGLAFDSNGNLYATGGSGGSDYSVFIYHSSNQLYCNHRYSDIYNEVQSRQYPDFNIIVDYHPSMPFVKYYHGQITNCNSSAIRFRFDISTETTTHIVEYVLNSNDELSLDNDYVQENQKKLSSTNAGTGISIANDAQGNPVISLDLPQAEGGGF